MRTLTSLLAVALLTLSGCDSWQISRQGVPPDPNWETPDGTASALLDGRAYTFRVYAQPSAYDPREVVLRAYADSLDRTLMLTFDLERGPADVNTGMTGYWDLGLCIPFRKYVVADPGAAAVNVERYEHSARRIQGGFTLRVVNEDDTEEVAVFTDGRFEAKVRHEPFEYCIEG